MQLIAQGDAVVSLLFALLAMLLFASGYLFLVKAIALVCQMCRARRFLSDLGRTQSVCQVCALLETQCPVDPFVRLMRRIVARVRPGVGIGGVGTGAVTGSSAIAPPALDSALGGSMTQQWIARERAEQSVQLQQGLGLLVVAGWLAPLAGLLAMAWVAMHAGGHWVQGAGMLQLGLVVTLVAWLGYVGLRAGNRRYLAQFDRLRQALAMGGVPGQPETRVRALPQAGSLAEGFRAG